MIGQARTMARPWPYDTRINGVGYICARDKDGRPIIRSKTVPLVAPTVPSAFNYGATDPTKEFTATFQRPVRGMGSMKELEANSGLYAYARNVDASCGLMVCGPEVTTVTPTGSTGPVRQIGECYINGSRALFMLSGTKIFVNTTAVAGTGEPSTNPLVAANWTESKDITPQQAMQAIWISTGPTTGYLVVIADTGKSWEFTGASATTVWSDSDTLGGANSEETSTDAGYTKIKEIVINQALTGARNISFDIKSNDGATTVYGRVYRNGSALGTEQTTTSGTFVTKTESINQTWAANDLLQLYVHSDGAATLTVRNFQMVGNGIQLKNAVVAKAGTTGAIYTFFTVHGDKAGVIYRNTATQVLASSDNLGQTTAYPAAAGSPIWSSTGGAPVSWLMYDSDTLYVYYERGLQRLTSVTGTAALSWESLDYGTTRSANAGRNSVIWNGYLYSLQRGGRLATNTDGGLDRIALSGSFSSKAVGPEKFVENNTIAVGRVTCAAGHQNWFLYHCIYDGTSSYLMKLGAWLNPAESNSHEWEFDEDAVHGIIATYASVQACSMFITDIGFQSPNSGLLVGCSDGSFRWSILPAFSPLPSRDVNCAFRNDGNTYIYFPRHTAGFDVNRKLYHAYSAWGPFLSASYYIAEVGYSIDASGEQFPASFTALNTDVTATGTRVPFHTSNPPVLVQGYGIVLKVQLFTSSTASTPVVEGIALHEQVESASLIEWEVALKAGFEEPSQGGRYGWRSPDQIREAVRSLHATAGAVSFVATDGVTRSIEVTDYSDERLPNGEYAIVVRGTQYALQT